MNTHFAIAVHALAALAAEGGGPLTAPHLAFSVGTNPVFLRRILRELKATGLVDIQRGAEGGVRLARAPERIGLDEVYAAVTAEGGLFKVHPAPSLQCRVGRHASAALGAVVAEADAALRRHLAGQTVADFLGRALEAEAAR